MPVLPLLAYGFATTFKMRDLARCFVGARIRQTKTQIVAEYDDSRFALGFDFGALVFVNIPSEERTRVMGLILGKVATEEPHPPLEEDFLVEVVPGTPAEGEVHFDRVVVPELDGPALDVIALLLAQSVAIDYYEEDLQEILADLDRRTDRMAARGRIVGSTRQIIRFVGSTISTKNQIIAALAVLDKPSITWEAEHLDRLYRALRAMLEIDDRFRALEYKLRTIQETMELFLDITSTRRSFILEITIVILILFELVVALAGKR
jgi:required for meiotic nuclear division protein 1